MVILYWSLLAIMLVGVVGAFVPALPGVGLILAAILVWGIVTGFAQVSSALVVAIIVLLLSLVTDYLAAYLGAKKVGASSWGQVGSIVGIVLGMLGFLPALPVGGPILGLLLGAMAGAFIGEFIYRRDLAIVARARLGLKVSLAIVVSSLIGNIIQGALAIAAMAVFVLTTWSSVAA
ncbi:MAG: DUF456 family protein [Leptolyngbya sp. SIO4C1]|nr:DUF456 family protein [Leptolyngbya sp. SIO4C1]